MRKVNWSLSRDTDLGSNVFADTCERSLWAGKAAPNCKLIQDTISAGSSQRNRCDNMVFLDSLKTERQSEVESCSYIRAHHSRFFFFKYLKALLKIKIFKVESLSKDDF